MRSRADVLIVEDEAVVRSAVHRILAEEHLEVVAAETAQAALEAIDSLACRLVLCDLMLPGVSGHELIPRLVEKAPETPVVVITGYATASNLLEVFSRGAFDFLPKPFDVSELVGVVRRGLRFRERRQRRIEAGEAPAGEPAPRAGAVARYGVGRHAWASLDADGSATLGVGETFRQLVADLTAVELPAVGDDLAQARCFVRILAEGVVYRVWAPLSGRVIAVNRAVAETPALLDRDPYGDGWLVRVVPRDLDEELGALSAEHGASAN